MPEPTGQQNETAKTTGLGKVFYLAFGWLCVGLGAAGAVLPVLPTTVFLILALWAFTRGSERYRHWLYTHPYFGPTLVQWHEHRVIPRRAKILACVMMVFSFALLLYLTDSGPWLPLLVAGIMIGAASYVLTRPSEPPPATDS